MQELGEGTPDPVQSPNPEAGSRAPLPEPDASILASRRLMTRDVPTDLRIAPDSWRDGRAWLLSTILHSCVLLLLALFWQPAIRGTGDLIDRPVGIAVFHQSASGDLYELSDGGQNGDQSNESSPEANSEISTPQNAPSTLSAPLDLSELTKDLEGYQTKTTSTAQDKGQGTGLSSTNTLSGTGTANGGNGSNGGSGRGVGGTGSTTASFMGLRGTGANFVYVLDRSASMEEFGGAPMRFAKSELMKSIASLSDKNQFQVVFYNESPGSLSPSTTGGKLLAANETNKDRAGRFIKAIKPLGGTEHIPGLKMGLSFGPDVLFFLTDAAEPAMTESQLIEIQSRAERTLTTIHTVQFNRGPAPNDGGWIRELAERNRGTYRYVDISNLE